MKLKTLGQSLKRFTEKDSNIAAELYNPGFDQNSDERDPSESLEPGRHDLAAKARQGLREWAASASESNVYAYASDRTFLEQASDDVKAKFELTSKNNATLGQLIIPSPRGVAIKSPSEAAGPGRIVSQGMLSGWTPAITSSKQKSTAYPSAPLDNAPLDQAIQSSLEEGNLHAPGRAYLSVPGSEMEDGTIRDGLYSLQNGSFGEFDPQRRRMEVDDLKRAVEATLENARGIVSDEGQEGGGAGDNINNILKSLANFAAPTIAPLQGIYDVRISKIQAIKEKFGEVEGQDEIARVREDFNLGDLFTKSGGITYGILNTPSQVFDGPPNGMIMTAFAGMLVLRGLIEVYGRFAHLLVSSSAKEPEGFWQLLPASVKRAANELGLNRSDLNSEGAVLGVFANNWLDSKTIIDNAAKGLKIFYGYQEKEMNQFFGIEIPSLLDYKSVFESPGFYANVTRVVLRDAQIITQFTQQNADSSSSTGIPNAINSLAALAENLLTAPSFRLVISMAKLGVQHQTVNGRSFLGEKDIQEYKRDFDYLNAEGKLNEFVNDDQYILSYLKYDKKTINEVQKDRNAISNLRFGEKKFSPLSNRYFPSLVFSKLSSPKNFNDFYAMEEYGLKTRFSSEQVDEIEALIDTDYVPFSIQDVRTNEVISLPSFIESISDSFNVNYESTHGYGRTDPVHSYSKTERNINISFVLVGFSQEDHQNVYNIVNKLTSMCYPQRSKGTRRSDGGIEFTQPLSQIPTASPLIRIRIGDLIRNNRTSDTFRWMFGDEESRKNAYKRQQEIKAELRAFANRWVLGEVKRGETLKLKGIPFPKHDFGDIGDPINIEEAPPEGFYKDQSIDVSIWSEPKKLFDEDSIVGPSQNGMSPNAYQFLIKNQGKLFYTLSDDLGNFYFANQVDDAALLRHLEPLSSPLPVPEADFYSANNNAVVRSFRSTSGRGLAGFIKDLQLDYSGFNWGIDPKFRAPMGVKVTMSFAPIHDAPLGLDHAGRIISPTHPVGYDYEGFK